MCIACLFLSVKRRGKLFAAAGCFRYHNKMQLCRNQDLFVGKKLLRNSVNQSEANKVTELSKYQRKSLEEEVVGGEDHLALFLYSLCPMIHLADLSI